MKVTHPRRAAQKVVPYLRVSCYEAEIKQMSYLHVIGVREAVFEYKDTHEGEFPPALWLLCKSRNQEEDNMTVFVDYMDKLLPRATEILFIGAIVSDASRPLVPAIFQF
jgi:hypothetical protein